MAMALPSVPTCTGRHDPCGLKPTRPLAMAPPRLCSRSGGLFARRHSALGAEVARRVDRVRSVVMAEAAGREVDGRRGGGDGRRGGRGSDGRGKRRSKRQPREAQEEKLEERVVQVSRVSKTVKGGRNISFRAVAVVGNENGRVGVGNKSAKEISVAVQKAVQEARKTMIDVPLSPKTRTFPHRMELSYGAARVMLRPASEGTGVIAGGAVKVVLELAGVQNCFGKQLGSNNPMNNAKATVEALRSMKTFKQVAAERDVSVPYLLGYSRDRSATWAAVNKEDAPREDQEFEGGPSSEETDASTPSEPVAA